MRSTQSAPIARASWTCHGSMRKSLRSTGREVAARAARRCSGEPRKNSRSVSTDRAAAPPRSYPAAMRGGSKSRRMRPRLGDARLISAMTAGRSSPIRASIAARKPRGAGASAARRRISASGTCRMPSSISSRLRSRMRARRSGMPRPLMAPGRGPGAGPGADAGLGSDTGRSRPAAGAPARRSRAGARRASRSRCAPPGEGGTGGREGRGA